MGTAYTKVMEETVLTVPHCRMSPWMLHYFTIFYHPHCGFMLSTKQFFNPPKHKSHFHLPIPDLHKQAEL